MEKVTLTPKEQTRLQVLNSLMAEHMTLDQTATLMGVSTRHTRRMLAAYRERGVAAVAHGHRGRRAPNATPEAVLADVVHLAGKRYPGANHTHLSELLSEREGIDIGRTTLRRILVNAGLKSPRRRRPPKHRVRRQRMPREGMLIQVDGSFHPWLGDQVPPFTLLIAVDDATGTVADALFCEKEEAYTYFLLIQDLVQSAGIPVALYVDRHGVFRHTPGSGLPGTSTQFSRAMDELGIQMIFALSPQANGRVERAAGTFQDRLVTELRLAGASSIGEANGVLEQFLPRYNRRFRVPRNALSPRIGRWTVIYTWTGCCASSTAGKWPRTIRLSSSCIRFSCCRSRNAPAMPARLWMSWKDWMAGSGCATRDASSTPGRRRPARYSSVTAREIRPLLSFRPPGPTTRTSAGQPPSGTGLKGGG